MTPVNQNVYLNQTGAVFGLDARLSLAIFGALTLIAGAYTALNINEARTDAFIQELRDATEAIQSIHYDLKTDLSRALENPTGKNAYRVLYDPSLLGSQQLRTRWLGPYLNKTNSTHPRYGEIYLRRRGEDIRNDCLNGGICYWWLVYDTFPLNSTDRLNRHLDGQETNTSQKGTVQWRPGTKDGQVELWYRATRTLSGGTSMY